MKTDLILGDCLEEMKKLEDNSVDSIVTDPPAGISFMGKEWDKDKGGRDSWIKWMQEVSTECLRVLKPGGHAFVWAIPRTSHWTATAWENAGFEIRDVVAHIFGSGFPKSHNIGKSVDKLQGNEREELGRVKRTGKESGTYGQFEGNNMETKGTSEYEGWGTALKPAREDWLLMRKPLAEKTVAKNCLKWKTGGINIDESRVVTEVISQHGRNSNDNPAQVPQNEYKPNNSWTGRFPANLIHDNSEEVRECFPNESERFFKSIIYQAKASKSERNKGMDGLEAKPMYKADGSGQSLEIFGSTDGGKEDRKNNHPTVKPISLMSYLIKMVTPPRRDSTRPIQRKWLNWSSVC